MTILPQVFSFIGAGLLLYSTFAKTKKNILLIQTGDCVFNAMAGLFVGSYASASTNLISAARNILTAKGLSTKAITAAFAAGICTIGLAVNRRGLIGILPAIASVQYTLWMFYAKAARTMKVGLLINVTVWLIHDTVIGLYPAMAVDIIIIAACIYNIFIKRAGEEMQMDAIRTERLTKSSIGALFDLIQEKYPLTSEIAKGICTGSLPTKPCTQVYGCFKDEKLVAIMTATYCIVFPHEDGTRIVHISGAYTKEPERHKGYATMLLNTIEKDATSYFDADYICCDSQADELYLRNGFKPGNCSRLWKQL